MIPLTDFAYEAAHEIFDEGHSAKIIKSHMVKVAEQEKERCAKIADSFDSTLWTDEQRQVAVIIAREIRCRV